MIAWLRRQWRRLLRRPPPVTGKPSAFFQAYRDATLDREAGFGLDEDTVRIMLVNGAPERER